MPSKQATVFILQETVAVRPMRNIWLLNFPDDFIQTGWPFRQKHFIVILLISQPLPTTTVMMKYMRD